MSAPDVTIPAFAHREVPARRSTGIGTQRKQRAFGLVLFLVILVLGVLGALLSRFSPATQRIERDKVTERVLAEAKAALIGYAARDPNRPGSLPCPDPKAVPDGRPSIADGDANPFNNPPFNCTDTSSTRIGRLPWRTLGLPEPRDGRGELLWYVVSPDFRANDTSALNSDVQGSLETRTAGGAVAASNLVALIIAPGSPVGNQSRPGNDPAQYVEFQNPSPPATGTPPVYPYQLLSGSNDSILPVSHRDLFTVVDQAVFSRIEETFVPKMQALAAQWGRYPFAMPFDPANLGARGETSTYEGSLPFAYASVSQAFWLGPSASWVGGAGTLNSQTCTVGPGSGLLNDKWMKCQVTHTGQITFRISVVARRGGRSFLDVSWDSTSSLSGASWSGALWGSPSASSATVRFTATTPNTTGTFTVRLRLELANWADPAGIATWAANSTYMGGAYVKPSSGTHYYRATTSGMSGSSAPTFPTDGTTVADGTVIWQDAGPDTDWILRNEWHRQLYYAIAPAYAFDGSGWCGSCLTVNGVPSPTNNKHAVVVLAGRQLNGLTRTSTVPTPSPLPAPSVPDYLENENQSVGDNVFRAAPRKFTRNDRVAILAP